MKKLKQILFVLLSLFFLFSCNTDDDSDGSVPGSFPSSNVGGSKSETPTIINIASVVAHAGYPLQSVYTASKHAILGLTKSIAAEYYQENIRVHAICPGGVYTDMVKVSRPDLTPDGMIMPEEIANIIHFFLANRGNAVVDEICVHRMNKTPFLI